MKLVSAIVVTFRSWPEVVRAIGSVGRSAQVERIVVDNASGDGTLDLCERGELVVLTRGDDPRTVARESNAAFTLADAVPAVVVSHGANGHGAWRAGGVTLALPAGHVDEAANAGAGSIYYARDYAAARADCHDDGAGQPAPCGFDDLLRWISPTILAARLVRAGRLP